MNRIASQIHKIIQKKQNFLLIVHKNPDGDAIGSASAFGQYLLKLKKNVNFFCSTKVPGSFDFLPHASDFVSDHELLYRPENEAIFFLDTGDVAHAGISQDKMPQGKNSHLINIDHHHSNQKYGDYNLILPDASSSAEVLFHFFKAGRININDKIATSLLTGLITDTINFTTPSTTVNSLIAAGELIKKGGDLNLIKKNLFKNKKINSLKLWGVVFSRISHDPDTNIVFSYLLKEDWETLGLSEEEAEGMSNFLNNISEGEAGLFLRENQEGKIKGSFRTTKENGDVCSLAKLFGGGGHKKAAGFTVDGPMNAAIKTVFGAIKQERLKKG